MIDERLEQVCDAIGEAFPDSQVRTWSHYKLGDTVVIAINIKDELLSQQVKSALQREAGEG